MKKKIINNSTKIGDPKAIEHSEFNTLDPNIQALFRPCGIGNIYTSKMRKS